MLPRHFSTILQTKEKKDLLWRSFFEQISHQRFLTLGHQKRLSYNLENKIPLNTYWNDQLMYMTVQVQFVRTTIRILEFNQGQRPKKNQEYLWLLKKLGNFTGTKQFQVISRTKDYSFKETFQQETLAYQSKRLLEHKMVKHTRTIRQQFADELLECVWPFCDIGA